MKNQNEYHYKLTLKKSLDKWLEGIVKDEHDLGWMPQEIVDNMTEAAWLIIKSNKDLNEYFESEKMIAQ